MMPKHFQAMLRSDVRPRELWAWAMYDFANSGYTTVVITALFNAYFVAVVAGNAPWATFAWTAALSVSYILIVFSAPLIGAYADLHAVKKKLLAITTVGCVLFTALLSFAQPAFGISWPTVRFSELPANQPATVLTALRVRGTELSNR